VNAAEGFHRRPQPPPICHEALTICGDLRTHLGASQSGSKGTGSGITLDKRTNICGILTTDSLGVRFGAVQDRIGKNVRLEESPAYKETILTFAPKSPGALEYRKLALEVIQRVQEDRIANHNEDAA
jgi:hypothetical protein